MLLQKRLQQQKKFKRLRNVELRHLIIKVRFKLPKFEALHI